MRVRHAGRLALLCSIFCSAFLSSLTALADAPPFDLSGPPVDVRVQRAGRTLPIAQVPNLLPGDRLWIHPAFPQDQAARYLLIVSFLRGATNPPPENWFTRAETWNKKVHEEGVFIPVPEGAEQALIFLAPETGGDFSTLRSAVRGRPGAFVRSSQDLNQASLDRSRLDKYLTEVRATAQNDPRELHARSELAARSLAIRLDPKCFDKPVEEQAACLTQHSDDLVLNDGHSQSVVGAATTGAAADLIGAIASTPQAGAGLYSAYVGAIIDLARILDNLHTAQYQYIPALTSPHKDQLDVRLNNPPSFHNPKSVIVIALPPVKLTQAPPLHQVERDQVECLQKESLVLPVEGAPLVFSTDLLHDAALSLDHPNADTAGAARQKIDLPATPDPARGGYVLDTRPLKGIQLGSEVTGQLTGFWGFDAFKGPMFRLRTAQPAQWAVPPEEKSALIVGRLDKLHLNSASAACVDSISMRRRSKDETPQRLQWKQSRPDQIEVEVPLENAQAGALSLLVQQAGLPRPDEVSLETYAEAGHLELFTISPGDQHGTLRGTRLDEVAGLDVSGLHFTPGVLARADNADELVMNTAGSSGDAAATANLQPGGRVSARATLKDGRSLDVKTLVTGVRPQVALLEKSVQTASATSSAIQLASPDEMPADARLTFSVSSKVPEKFPRTEKLEIANDDGSLHATLTTADGSLMLQDQSTVLATFDPQKSLGPSAFGALKLRPVSAEGVAGDWQPLITLVRLPALEQLQCAANAASPCTLVGSNLFLLDSVAGDESFNDKVLIPQGFVGSSLQVPHPATAGTLYIRLRDAPGVTSRVAVPMSPRASVPASPAPAGALHRSAIAAKTPA